MSAVVALLIRAAGLFGLKLSPFWGGAIAAGAVAAALGIGALCFYNAGYAAADNQAQLAVMQARIATLEADRDNARHAAASASAKLASVEANAAENKKGTADYVQQLKARPAPDCDLTDADLRGMRLETRPGRRRPRSPSAAGDHGAGGIPTDRAAR